MWSVQFRRRVDRYSRKRVVRVPYSNDARTRSVWATPSIYVMLGPPLIPPGAAMQQIADWLQKLGLGQYAQRFAENEIDVSVLPHLTDQDLKDIGVPLGPRRKILAAITTETRTTNATPERDASIELKAQDTAERRQVTVMFSDLVGSTALSARMDPEDLREVISAYQKCVAETVQRFGGFVAKYMGDGVLVYFGYPQAHEDDAERAVRGGLELVAAVGTLKTHTPLQTRVGIATGLVVVGDLIGSGASQEQAIVGETPNLAARLQAIAEPNKVVIAESTRKLLGNLFDLEDDGSQDLKGIAGPVRAWVALGQASVEGRFEAFHASGVTELVGREEELEILLRRWSKAKSGEGQVVLLSGERHRQISFNGWIVGTPRFGAAHALAIFLLSTAHGQRALPDH
jgi:class 3 adenylate cyclase